MPTNPTIIWQHDKVRWNVSTNMYMCKDLLIALELYPCGFKSVWSMRKHMQKDHMEMLTILQSMLEFSVL